MTKKCALKNLLGNSAIHSGRAFAAIAIAALVMYSENCALAMERNPPVIPLSDVKSEFVKIKNCKFGPAVKIKTSGDYLGAPNLVVQQVYPCGADKRVLIEYYTVPFWFWEKEQYLRSKIEFQRPVNKHSDSFDIWFQKDGTIEQIVWFPYAQQSKDGDRFELIRDQRLVYSSDGKLITWDETVIRADHQKKMATFTTKRYDPLTGKQQTEQHGDWDYDEFACREKQPHCQR